MLGVDMGSGVGNGRMLGCPGRGSWSSALFIPLTPFVQPLKQK